MAIRGHIAILTGAGISAESGVPTFRGTEGLWENRRIEDVASPEAFRHNPQQVHAFYNARRKQLLEAGVRPNRAHLALADLERKLLGKVTIITQNIDPLHELAGSQNVIHMHGELLKAHCSHCGAIAACAVDLSINDECARCGARGTLRPHVVWFGESPYRLDEIHTCLAGCRLYAAIGTSGVVYPAAGFVALAKNAGAHTVEINIQKTPVTDLFDRSIQGRATAVVPPFVASLLEEDHLC